VLSLVLIRNRQQIAYVAGQGVSRISGFIQSITNPVGGKHAVAYLTVLRGDEALLNEHIPVYANAVLPMGKDPQQSEVLFSPDNRVVSRKHCEIHHVGDTTFEIKDWGSTNGTFINKVKLDEFGVKELHDQDEITLGPVANGGVMMRFEVALPDGTFPTETNPA
jgi:hypothetical protein